MQSLLWAPTDGCSSRCPMLTALHGTQGCAHTIPQCCALISYHSSLETLCLPFLNSLSSPKEGRRAFLSKVTYFKGRTTARCMYDTYAVATGHYRKVHLLENPTVVLSRTCFSLCSDHKEREQENNYKSPGPCGSVISKALHSPLYGHLATRARAEANPKDTKPASEKQGTTKFSCGLWSHWGYLQKEFFPL